MLHCRTVSLEKGADGLGFSIVGGHGSPQGNLPIYIKTVFGNCAAASGDRVKCGDRILAVNGISLDGLKHEDVVDVLKKCSGTVRLTILS
ncbi:UNVERIFIED_CONTAM: hypothetical protein PYX00_000804 [Menopon gallinae]|uniref:PDZ domain-containing protein n=1 Tax=Menopon gallinae TaxID=328185 RepID=A0AAW2IB83_9NEOP